MGPYFTISSSNLEHSLMLNKLSKQVDSSGLITASGQHRRNKVTVGRDISFTAAVVSQRLNKRMNSSLTGQLLLSVYFYSLTGGARDIAMCALLLSINCKCQSCQPKSFRQTTKFSFKKFRKYIYQSDIDIPKEVRLPICMPWCSHCPFNLSSVQIV